MFHQSKDYKVTYVRHAYSHAVFVAPQNVPDRIAAYPYWTSRLLKGIPTKSLIRMKEIDIR